MEIVHAREPLPASVTRTLFLAGPTPRSPDVQSYRPALLAELARQGYDGTVFVPEPRDGAWAADYDAQIAWETEALHRADAILFWVPRAMGTLPGLTTNVEYGAWASSGKIVLGAPPGAEHVRYLFHHAAEQRVPVAADVPAAVAAAIALMGEGAARVGGECEVPLHVFRHPTFRGWYDAQRRAGHRLEHARVLWSYFAGPERSFFAFALRVALHVPGEDRVKRELLIGRTDVCSVLLYRPGATLLDTEVLLVREVRAPARTGDGQVHELPGGSSWSAGEPLIQVALHEVEEETGIRPGALFEVGARQLAATLLAHEATLFAAEIGAEEMALIRAGEGEPRGVVADGERCYTEVRTVRRILDERLCDWSTVGMILSVIAPRYDAKS
jgi:8-oxo-dGTP pyrophosphatase MutT (NUDIX family)